MKETSLHQYEITSWRARRCLWKKKKKLKKNFEFIFAYNTPRPPMSVHEKFQPNWSRRLAGYMQPIYKNVLFYNKDRSM